MIRPLIIATQIAAALALFHAALSTPTLVQQAAGLSQLSVEAR